MPAPPHSLVGPEVGPLFRSVFAISRKALFALVCLCASSITRGRESKRLHSAAASLGPFPNWSIHGLLGAREAPRLAASNWCCGRPLLLLPSHWAVGGDRRRWQKWGEATGEPFSVLVLSPRTHKSMQGASNHVQCAFPSPLSNLRKPRWTCSGSTRQGFLRQDPGF